MELDKTIAFLFAKRRVDFDTGCWEWTGGRTAAGYGRIAHGRRLTLGEGLAHRLSARVFLGLELGDPRLVLHSCDNPPCFNYAHLRMGTAADNAADIVARGRRPTMQSKLSWPQVRTIRAFPPTTKLREIAALYGVTLPTISGILRNTVYVDPDYAPQYRIAPGRKWKKATHPRFPAPHRVDQRETTTQGVLFTPG